MHPSLDRIIRDVLHPNRFWRWPRQVDLRVVEAETLHWEVFCGHLLTTGQTREERTMAAWHVVLNGEQDATPAPPRLAVRHDAESGTLYVTRSLEVYGWQPYEDLPGVILSRPARKWSTELVGTLESVDSRQPEHLREELAWYVFLAIVGTSRLPITSLESPLPAFTLGELTYVPAAVGPATRHTDPEQLLYLAARGSLPLLVRAKLWEAGLRALPLEAIGGAADRFAEAWQQSGQSGQDLVALGRTLFCHLALSPYTDFGARLASFLSRLGHTLLDEASLADLVGFMLRHLARHLSAFDLVTFHNFGANYPDALLLDDLLALLLDLTDRQPHLFQGAERAARWRRRAFRQAYLVRRHYE